MADPTNGQLYVVPDPPKVFRREGLGYVFEPAGAGVRFRADRLTRNGGELKARITVENCLPGLPSFMYRGRHLLEGSRSLADLKKGLEEIAGPEHGIPWGGLTRQFVASVVDAEEAGAPIVRVGAIPKRPPPPDLVQYLVTRDKTSVIYGPGGYGKGWLAVGIAVAVASGRPFAGLAVGQGPVLYLDWEDDENVFRHRVELICTGLPGPPIDVDTLPLDYRRCERPLPDDVDTLSRDVDARGYVLLIVDSVEMASLSGEHQNYNDRATAMARALRLVLCSHLLVDHVSDEGRRGKELAGKAIGGVMKGNLSRNQWEIKRDQEIGATESHIGLYQTKQNHTARLPPIGFCLDFDQPDAVRITREDVRESTTLAAPLSLTYRIDAELRRGLRTVPELVEALDAKSNSIVQTLRRGEQRGRYVQTRPDPSEGVLTQWGRRQST